MTVVLHTRLPDAMCQGRALPGVAPLKEAWLRVDEAYDGQMALRRRLLTERTAEVLAEQPEAGPAVAELFAYVTADLGGLGYVRDGAGWRCPDGVWVPVGRPLETLGRLCQADMCLMEKPEGAREHVLTAAVLCFPASWRLAEKIGQPLTAIHGPVREYDQALAARVQRMFDGVQVGRPLWRFNRLWYEDAGLFQPRSEAAPRHLGQAPAPYFRAERQVILRLPETGAVVFSIHTFVLRREDVPDLG